MFVASTIEDNQSLFMEYCRTLVTPMDSFVEDYMLGGTFKAIMIGSDTIGYFIHGEKDLLSFYLSGSWTRYGPSLFERAISENCLKEVYFQTSDSYLLSLLTDWEFDKKKSAYFFQNYYDIPEPLLDYGDVNFRPVGPQDMEEIHEKTAGFFSPDDIRNGDIYALRSGEALLGCGIAIRGRFFTDCASIGMVTCKEHRRRGVGRYILWRMKQWCYERGLEPIAGCWYYNTLSRRSLESVGMSSRSRGMRALLIGKEAIPERTGNPPGEPV
jgi:GNAT superfamily N-acetyltransferase